ncbi:MAG: radical SAM protein [Planctomycetes bacterium]|nr:radical SAM protein [Planctomycetota bacterium]
MPSSVERARRYLALARAVLRARRRAFDPFKLTWILTEQCSLRCRTCHLWVGEPHAGPSADVVERVLVANPQLTWLNLSGGDLVERPDAPALLESVARHGRDLALVDFPTAGQDTRATLAALQPLLGSDVPRVYVTVSLDGPDAVHDRLRGVPGAAERARATLAALARIRRPGFRAVAGMTLSKHNVPDARPDDLRALLPDAVPAGELHVNLAHHSSHYYRNTDDVAPPSETALALLDEVLAARPRGISPLTLVERRYAHLARRFLLEGRVPGRCGALRASVYLASDLTVYPCTIFDRPIGNLADVGYALRRIPELLPARAALAEVEARACPGCWSPCEAFPTLLAGLGRTL